MEKEIKIPKEKLHIKVKNHLVKHGKKLGSHIKKHHRKYTTGAAIYSVFHVAIIKVLALKFLALKLGFGVLALLGIYESPMMGTFAQIDNICIDNKALVAEQKCEKNFSTIEDTLAYIESTVNTETDTIYNAGHYSIVSSILKTYCGKKIPKTTLKGQISLFKALYKIKDSSLKMNQAKITYEQGKMLVAKKVFSGTSDFCTTKYEAYDTLRLTQKEFLKEFKKKGLLKINPLTNSGNSSAVDGFILAAFYNKADQNYKSYIENTMSGYKDSYAQILANTIKTKGLQGAESALKNLESNGILTKTEIDTIKNKLSIVFTPSCNKNTGIHSIDQYYSDKNILTDIKVNKIQLNIGLCKSYQYIDELPLNVQKLLIHEIGHYIYYFKDTTADRFQKICWDKTGKKYAKCTADAFVTKYSQTSAEEDYAETFSRWAIAKIYSDEEQTLSFSSENVHGTADTTTKTTTKNTSTLNKKFNYFDIIFSKARSVVLGY